ncbi:inner membrane-spanning protein YciB [Roseovarius atlanticus]|uniref:inner membrane-spanning protein YciB n=1 Tax=Roseovarius atlanticus TaxID=1641875 RepID=UPI001C94935A|nr:inner membrane-spanning protein YciB [Roseovarius atlanticus]MBY5988077.1 septation protein IspZ [Roseovarius atlanticus]MBY6123468.1 septation protein IspZ [Roseovarius atlanticus]MBY6147963.1 septation protein IspZ [Roseovarius atlanticus]
MDDKNANGKLKAVLEFGPVLGFFVAYLMLKDRVFTIGGTEYEGFIVITAVFIPVLLASTALMWKLTGHLSKMQILTAVLVVVFGGLTVWLNDPKFFQMKPTIIYLFFGTVLGIGLLRGRSYLQYVMDGLMPLTDRGWMILTKRITIFFFAMAALNELVWRTQSEETWVYFKTFGLMAAMFVFFMMQGKLIAEHGTDDGGKS